MEKKAFSPLRRRAGAFRSPLHPSDAHLSFFVVCLKSTMKKKSSMAPKGSKKTDEVRDRRLCLFYCPLADCLKSTMKKKPSMVPEGVKGATGKPPCRLSKVSNEKETPYGARRGSRGRPESPLVDFTHAMQKSFFSALQSARPRRQSPSRWGWTAKSLSSRSAAQRHRTAQRASQVKSRSG